MILLDMPRVYILFSFERSEELEYTALAPVISMPPREVVGAFA